MIYSGKFLGNVEVDAYDVTRVMIGINPFEFTWSLEEGENFETLEGILVYSDKDLNGMSQNFHNLLRNNLINKNIRMK